MLFQFDPTTFNEKMTVNKFLLYKYLQTISICIELSFLFWQKSIILRRRKNS